ncbi:MAG: bile acid:sodium symporter family protein [Bryobacteraceae bacterium]
MRAKTFLMAAGLALAAAAFAWQAGAEAAVGPAALVGLLCLILSTRMCDRLKGFTFTLSVFSFVTASMFYPWAFDTWGGFKLTRLIVPLIQIIMFGMGTSLSVKDFVRAFQMPKAVGIGMFLQFTIMPLTGWTLAGLFGFDPAVAAGVILIGSCPGGVASNVMTYLANGNVALSVTMTACSTLVAPLATPAAMKVLAGQYVPIDFWEMMVSILNMIILPIVAGLIANKLIHGRAAWLDKALPVLSMSAICFIIAIITASSRDKLLEVGLALIAVSIMHNAIGYLLGYWGARTLGLAEGDSRTVAIEVGLQNGGMASGLAINVLKSTDAALAPAIFGPWMNISGSVLASWWRGKPVRDKKKIEAAMV